MIPPSPHKPAEVVAALPEEKLRALLDGAAKATPGPWQYTMCDDQRPMVNTEGDIVCLPDYNHGTQNGLPDDMDVGNFAHLAACDPQTITALANEVLASRTLIEQQAAQIRQAKEVLSDPTAVRANILRGIINIPDDLVWLRDTNGPVAALVAKARADTIEECAKVAEAAQGLHVTGDFINGLVAGSPEREFWRGFTASKEEIAASIRTLSQGGAT